MNLPVTYINSLTSLSPNAAKIPIHFDTDREAITRALDSLPLSDPRQAKILRIADTLSLDKLHVSETFAQSLRDQKDLEPLTGPEEMKFDTAGNLETL